MSLTSNDLQALIEYVNKKDSTVKQELTEELLSIRSKLTEDVRQYIFEEVKTNPEFRGPTGYTGQDGDRGPIGENGPEGPLGRTPSIDVDVDGCRVRFQTGLNEGVAEFSEWVNIKGPKGELGEQGPQGLDGKDGSGFVKASIYEDTLYLYDDTGNQHNLGNVRGREGPQGLQGPIGEAFTWHDLTEAQRELLVGPSGVPGPKGDPGTFPMVECDHEARKIRFQIREDYTNPWGEWIDMPVGPQGDKGDKGDRWMYEDFKPEHLAEITGPMGPQGPQGPKGAKGDKGDIGPKGPRGNTGARGEKGDRGEKGRPGKDGDIKPIEELVDDFKDKVTKEHTRFDKRLKDTTEKLRSEITNRMSDARFTRLNELLIPTASFSVAGDPSNNEIYQEVEVDNWQDIINGAPIYIDNTIKASVRGDTYDPDNFLIYASAEHISQVADGIIIKGVNRKAYIYRLGIVKVDPRAIADGNQLHPGEYYYLAHPTSYQNSGQITVNKPTYGVAQLVGQAISTTEIFVNTTTDPVILNRTNLVAQGRNGATLPAPVNAQGSEGDSFGDVIWDDKYYYFCFRDHDGISNIWRRIEYDASW